jgi:hypothetical protein
MPSSLLSNFLKQLVPGMFRLLLDVHNVPDKKNTEGPYCILYIYISIDIILGIYRVDVSLHKVPVSLKLT